MPPQEGDAHKQHFITIVELEVDALQTQALNLIGPQVGLRR